MPALAQALVAVALVSTAIVVAAPTQEKAVRRAAASDSRTQRIDEGRRRSKRQILVEEAPMLDEEEQIKQELSELSDSQLRVLADIVQTEIERYNEAEQPAEEYEIIEIPDEMIMPGRMRRNAPIFEDDAPELVVVPDEILEDALEEQEADLELRSRIAEIAQILNERANRPRF